MALVIENELADIALENLSPIRELRSADAESVDAKRVREDDDHGLRLQGATAGEREQDCVWRAPSETWAAMRLCTSCGGTSSQNLTVRALRAVRQKAGKGVFSTAQSAHDGSRGRF